MLKTINGIPGRIYWGDAHPEFRKLRPLYCFVPEGLLSGETYDEVGYMNSIWPSYNCGANPHGIGSHTYPDILSPVADEESTPELVDFLENLRLIFL